MTMNVANDMKHVGLLCFLRQAAGGHEMSLEFKPGKYSIPVTITLDAIVVTKYLSLVPADGQPNLQLVITDAPVVPADAPAAPAVEVAPVVPLSPPAPVVPAAPVVPVVPVDSGAAPEGDVEGDKA